MIRVPLPAKRSLFVTARRVLIVSIVMFMPWKLVWPWTPITWQYPGIIAEFEGTVVPDVFPCTIDGINVISFIRFYRFDGPLIQLSIAVSNRDFESAWLLDASAEGARSSIDLGGEKGLAPWNRD